MIIYLLRIFIHVCVVDYIFAADMYPCLCCWLYICCGYVSMSVLLIIYLLRVFIILRVLLMIYPLWVFIIVCVDYIFGFGHSPCVLIYPPLWLFGIILWFAICALWIFGIVRVVWLTSSAEMCNILVCSLQGRLVSAVCVNFVSDPTSCVRWPRLACVFHNLRVSASVGHNLRPSATICVRRPQSARVSSTIADRHRRSTCRPWCHTGIWVP